MGHVVIFNTGLYEYIYMPKQQTKNKTSSWIDGECLHLIHLKKRAWTKAKDSNTPQDWEQYKIANNTCKKTLNDKYNIYMETAFEDLNTCPKKFWNLVSIRNNNKSQKRAHNTYNI